MQALLLALLAQNTVVLYSNDFETSNVPFAVGCGNSLDQRGINFLYGTAGFQFSQVNTVEGVAIDDPSGLYSNTSSIGGNYAIGMLSNSHDDKLALTLDAGTRAFVNVGFHLSSIDVSGCGGPFGFGVPVMQVSLYETPSGVHNRRGQLSSTPQRGPGRRGHGWGG